MTEAEALAELADIVKRHSRPWPEGYREHWGPNVPPLCCDEPEVHVDADALLLRVLRAWGWNTLAQEYAKFLTL